VAGFRMSGLLAEEVKVLDRRNLCGGLGDSWREGGREGGRVLGAHVVLFFSPNHYEMRPFSS